MSGGLDSSAVTALAVRALKDEGAGPVRSFTADFVGAAEDFVPTRCAARPTPPPCEIWPNSSRPTTRKSSWTVTT
ncbi:asparagine synthase-related protein [Streptomyces sp. CG1]|uniref:asparagine synthase-related protein n=1 Tax=Streptomyces sp. CG1 TaxID=1287523 RepID=UPI0034E1B5E8